MLAAAALAVSLPAAAQMQRNFPADALRGELQVLQPPEATLNGRPVRLAPGARIRGDNNLVVVSARSPGVGSRSTTRSTTPGWCRTSGC